MSHAEDHEELDTERRLKALEFELRHEEDQIKQEEARLRAEELKKRSQEPERVIIDQANDGLESISDKSSDSKLPFHGESSQIYLEVLLLAYRDGKLGKNEADILALLRRRFGLSDKEHHRLEQKVHWEIFSQSMVDLWQDGVITPQEAEKLDLLQAQLGISAEDRMRLDQLVRRRVMERKATTTP